MTSKTSGWVRVAYILLAVLYIFTGIFFMSYPGLSEISLGYCIAFMTIFYGGVVIASYFLNSTFKTIWSLIIGICMIIVGIVVMMNVPTSMSVIAVIVGIGYILVGVYKTVQSFSLKDLGLSNWWLALILGILTIIVGCILAFNPDNGAYLAVLVGATLLVNGVSDLFLGFLAF